MFNNQITTYNMKHVTRRDKHHYNYIILNRNPILQFFSGVI